MSKSNLWQMLRQGNAVQALTLFREAYTREPDARNIIQLGTAYLWVEDYVAALDHFQHAIKTYRSPSDVFFGMAGAASWCSDEIEGAIRYWRQGLGAPYALGGSVVRLPLLFFVASILRPRMFPIEEAAEMMQLRVVNDLRIKNWPGPLAKFVLGLLDETALNEISRQSNTRDVLPYRCWQVDFYKAVLDLGRGTLNRSMFKQSMLQMVNTSQSQWSDQKHFAYLVRCEEFFIARHEAAGLVISN
jgi:tetratricopeptide (TPR) repeat protein